MKRLLLTALTLLGISIGVFAYAGVQPVLAATPEQEVCQTIGGTANGGNCTTNKGPSLTGIVRTAINLFSLLVGIVAVFMVVFSGFRYVTSAGDPSKISSAKNTLIYAIVGIVVVAFAQFIVQFVIDRSSANPSQPNRQTYLQPTKVENRTASVV